ncbi:MAG: hypothetical protein HYY04_09775 [Chloroflexi bacterium]|nr:hypothetical protein [Chloroflexota bacterium]
MVAAVQTADTTATIPSFTQMPGTATRYPPDYESASLVDWWGLTKWVWFEPSSRDREYFHLQLEELHERMAATEWRRDRSKETSTGPRDPTTFVRPELEQLEGFANLEPDWDSYGAAPISGKAISTARRLMTVVAEQFGDLLGERVRPYAVAPVADGGVYVEWRGPGGQLQVQVGPDGNLTYLLVKSVRCRRVFEERSQASSTEVLSAAAGVLSLRLAG